MVAIDLTHDSEAKQEEIRISEVETLDNPSENLDLMESMAKLKTAFFHDEIYMVIIYYVLVGFIQPDFGTFKDVFDINLCKQNHFDFQVLAIIPPISGIIGILIFYFFLQK